MTGVDPVTSEVIKSSLVYASEEMGIAVRNSAYSPNIKERLDHSCALFDPDGRLIAQAEHIPVHLGSLPWGLRTTLGFLKGRNVRFASGDMWVVNDPYISGTHLNDVTVIRPIFDNARLAGFAANKAHHTDLGGAAPGSMSADATDLFAEGFIVPPIHLMQRDEIVGDTIALFRANSRAPEARSGDLKAQIAGNITGERRLLELIRRYGPHTFEAAIERILDESERRIRAELRALGQGTFRAVDFLEDQHGDPTVRIQLGLTLCDGRAVLDYSGTSAQTTIPLNAVYGVTLSGVYYALRAVCDPTIPMNEGCFRPIDVCVPAGTLLNPLRPAPVSGGNVETSTRNADVVMQALAQAAPDRVPASSGGTMSNVMMGGLSNAGESWAFYETNGCGMGARPNMDGIDGIQCHMTNTLNTPIEAIERYYPLRITRYELAENTGGEGRFRGGCGLIRALELREGTCRVSLLADRHTLHPQGSLGGEAGACGVHMLQQDRHSRKLPAKTTLNISPGDIIIVQTPGGGGYGVSMAK
ncbi:MAG: hydantoinase B/oxoprolinase family protein [Candidatus Eremiobacteraeota bacterium]|nr:hydantoinase B/oxoprolinase family protein [Candidatus Eremiobacteraeota bacterium]MDQ6933596.1 hydantoinase B/oxoprolinase family protein [Candidatus Eremiobacteraeota bacterium]